MTRVENSGGIQASLSGRYATALFGLARDEKAIDAVSTSLQTLKTALAESDDFRRLVASPRAIGAVNKVGGGLLVGAGVATIAFAGQRS